MRGHLWTSTDICGHLETFVDILGHPGTSADMRVIQEYQGKSGKSVDIRVHPCSLVDVRGYIYSFVDIWDFR